MPGVTVDLISITFVFFFVCTLSMSFSALSKTSILTEPSLFAGVGTDRNIKSDSFTVSSNVCVDLLGFIS